MHNKQRRTLGNSYCQTGILVLASSIPNYATSVLLDVHVLCQVLGNLRMTSRTNGEFF
jgi:hypothetical protein